MGKMGEDSFLTLVQAYLTHFSYYFTYKVCVIKKESVSLKCLLTSIIPFMYI